MAQHSPYVIPSVRPSPAQAIVHIVDDDASVCQAFASMVATLPCPWRCHASCEDFLAAYDPLQPACLVLDVSLAGRSGLDLLLELKERALALPTVVVSASAEVERVVSAMQRGAFTFMQKPPDPRRLLQHLREMIAAAAGMAEQRRRLRGVRAALATLTPRESEVLKLLLAGRSTKQVALELGLRGRTAHIHRANVLRKLQVDTPCELLRLAAISGGEIAFAQVTDEPCLEARHAEGGKA
jgi:two-component system, LuxR family, response regulator FixJ